MKDLLALLICFSLQPSWAANPTATLNSTTEDEMPEEGSLAAALSKVVDPLDKAADLSKTKNQSYLTQTLQFFENRIVLANLEPAEKQATEKEAQKEVGAEINSLSLTEQTVQTAKKARSWLAKEWAKADVPVDIPLNVIPRKTFDAGSFALTGQYQQKIRPTGFESSLQDRRDILRFRAQANAHDFSAFSELEFIWSRMFELDDKWKIYRIPRPSRVPVTPEKALMMQPGEVVRLRLSFGAGLNFSEDVSDIGDELTAPVRTGIGVSQELYTDVYRLAGNRVEVRLAAIGTPPTPSLGFSIENFTPITATVNLGLSLITKFFNRQIRRYLQFDPLSIRGSKTVADNLRTDTRVAFYDLDLSTPDGATAYRKIFQTSTLVNILKEIIRLERRVQLGERLKAQSNVVDRLHLAHLHEPESQRPVMRKIQGSIISDVTNSLLRTNWMGRVLFRYSLGHFNADSEVRIYDPYDKLQTYRFLSDQRDMEWRARLSLRGDNDRRLVYGLFSADVGENRKLLPTNLLGLIFRHEFAAKNMTVDQVNYFRDHFQDVHKDWGKLISWQHFGGDSDKDLGTVTYEYFFKLDDILEFPILSPETIHEKVRQVLSRYRHRDELLTSKDPLRENIGQTPLMLDFYPDELLPVVTGVKSINFKTLYDRVKFDAFENDIRTISKGLSRWLLATDPKEKFDAIENLMDNNLFFEFGPNLMMALLPEADPSQHFYFNLVSSHADAVKVPAFERGKKGSNDLYVSVQSQMSYLQSREFDNRIRQKAVLDSGIYKQ